jgi:hypothetical protein
MKEQSAKLLVDLELEIEVIPTPCPEEIDFECTPKEKQKIYDDAEINVWAWCDVEVKVTIAGKHNSAYLGFFNYKDKQDFLDSGYYDDMVQEAVTKLVEMNVQLICKNLRVVTDTSTVQNQKENSNGY